MRGFQYNEESILRKLFPNKTSIDYSSFPETGLVVEIGAADGVDNSNSYWLINECSWDALLVEPHNGYFMDLLMRYTDHEENVKLSNYAISDKDCRKTLYLDGQCSSLIHRKQFGIEVQCVTLTNLFKLYKIPHVFDFLSIDCEGEDMNVLRSLDWKLYKPKAVCVEHSMPHEELVGFMTSVGYQQFDRNTGNTFFVLS